MSILLLRCSKSLCFNAQAFLWAAIKLFQMLILLEPAWAFEEIQTTTTN
jgi:hypothetical protein